MTIAREITPVSILSPDIVPPNGDFLRSAQESARSNLACFDVIKRPDLKEIITPETPVSYWTMELYRKDIKGQGGLGMLASDTLEVARKLGIPTVFMTPFYTEEKIQKIEKFKQEEVIVPVEPFDRGFTAVGSVHITTAKHEHIPLGIYAKQEGSVTIYTVTEPNFGQLYQGKNYDDHRLYQEVALGFGGHKALKEMGITPSLHQLNEAPTIFSAFARLDDRIQQLTEENPEAASSDIFAKALVDIRENTIYTNHTLVQAVEAEFTLEQFEHFVLPNITAESLRDWLRDKFNGKGNAMKLSTLAIALASKKNGVSLIHAREASREYTDYDGNPVEFAGVTNGISLDRWTDPDLLTLYRTEGILDQFDLPQEGYQEKIQKLQVQELKQIKERAKIALRTALQEREDQYGNPIDIPVGAKVFDWRRRIADYKRPGMLFDQPEQLAQLLEEGNIHLVMAGKAHSTDERMQKEMTRIFELIDANPILKARVHFVQNYDEDIARKLVQGADVSINTPVVQDEKTGRRKSTEACGTSWEKDIINNTILISTDDGGVADLSVEAEEQGIVDFIPPYLQVRGKNYQEEVASLYAQMQKATAIIDEADAIYSWESFVKQQANAYMPIISGARMEVTYLNFGIPKKVPAPDYLETANKNKVLVAA